MIYVKIPNNFLPEKKYIIEILLNEFLGLSYELRIGDQTDYKIILEDGKRIVIKDCFFLNFNDDLSYLNIANIPKDVRFVSNQFTPEKDIPVIYGNEELSVTDNEIICGIDIFASSFFMLTRWEEYVNKSRDIHNRFPASESLAYKNNFLERPVVNEYVDMLWNILKFLGINLERKKRDFEFVMTHDVDKLLRWKTISEMYQYVKTNSMYIGRIQAFRDTLNFLKIICGLKKDPLDTYDYMINNSERAGIKSRFYFMSGGETEYDDNYLKTRKFQKILRRIKKRGHIIGFHPSYDSYNDPIKWRDERNLLECTCKCNITESRQHYLRFSIPETWQISEDNNMKVDSTLGYPEKPGFRCGICYVYNVFNVCTRKKLKLKERPLIIMDGTYKDYLKETPKYLKESVIDLTRKVKKYNGQFVFLWHNSSINSILWRKYQKVYEECIIYMSQILRNNII